MNKMLHWRGADIADTWRRCVKEDGSGVLFSGFGYQSCLHRHGIGGGLMVAVTGSGYQSCLHRHRVGGGVRRIGWVWFPTDPASVDYGL